MSLSGLISKNLLTSFKGQMGDSIKISLANSPLSALFRQLSDIKNAIVSRQSGYDAISCGLISCDGIFDDVASLNFPEQLTMDRSVSIDDEQAELLFDGFVQGKQYLNEASGVVKEFLSITTAVGQSYSFRMNEQALKTKSGSAIETFYNNSWHNFLTFIDGTWTLPSVIKPCNFASHFMTPTTVADKLSLLGFINNVTFETAEQTLIEVCNKLNINITGANNIRDYITLIANRFNIPFTTISNTLTEILKFKNIKDSIVQPEPFINLITSVVDSAEINATLADAIDSITNNKFVTWLQHMKSTFNSVKKSIKILMQGFAQAYYGGGLKGVMMYIINFYKQPYEAKLDDDGIFKFTDNNGMVPREYIAGVVTVVAGAVWTVVSTILTVIGKVIGPILAMLGSILWSGIGSFNYDYNATKASLYYNSNPDFQSIGIIPYIPSKFFSGEWLNVPKWYSDMYQLGNSIVTLDVPGGAVIVGPGSYNDKGDVTKVRWEFHPAAICFADDVAAKYTDLSSITYMYETYASKEFEHFVRMGFDLTKIFDLGGHNFISKLWYDLTSNQNYASCINFITNTPQGFLSDHDDLRLRESVTFSCCLFVLWNWFFDRNLNSLIDDASYVCLTASSIDSDHSIVSALEQCFSFGSRIGGHVASDKAMTSYHAQELQWKDIITMEDVESKPLVVSKEYGRNIPLPVMNEYNISVIPNNCNYFVIDKGQYYGTPWIFPEEAVFAVTMPTYNASTFWLWVTAAAVLTVAVSVTVAVASFKFSKWKQRKRADNKQKFDSKGSAYADAVNGEIRTLDDQGHEIVQEFDVKSPEGKAYIKQCYKDYYRQARKNNLWQHIVGGSRYDVGTFWGEADVPEDEEVAVDEQAANIIDYFMDSEVGSAFTEVDPPEDEGTYDYTAELALIKKLISGN